MKKWGKEVGIGIGWEGDEKQKLDGQGVDEERMIKEGVRNGE